MMELPDLYNRSIYCVPARVCAKCVCVCVVVNGRLIDNNHID